jgi:hypothetical protein
LLALVFLCPSKPARWPQLGEALLSVRKSKVAAVGRASLTVLEPKDPQKSWAVDPRLLVHREPGRKVTGKRSSSLARADEVAETAQGFEHRLLPLRHVAHKRQIGCHERSLGVRLIGPLRHPAADNNRKPSV